MWISALNFLTDVGSSIASAGAEAASSEIGQTITGFVTWAVTEVVETIFP